jgi:hypothetical protein
VTDYILGLPLLGCLEPYATSKCLVPGTHKPLDEKSFKVVNMFEETAESETDLEACLDAMERVLERREAQQRQKRAFECELH